MFKNNKLLLILKCAWPQATFYICDLQPATRNLQNITSQDWGAGRHDHMVVGIRLPVQSVPMTTKVVSLNPTHSEVCSIQCYVIKWLVAGWWFSPGTPVSSTNKIDCHNITEILLKHHKPNQDWHLPICYCNQDWYLCVNLPFIFSDLYSTCFKSSKIQNQTIWF